MHVIKTGGGGLDGCSQLVSNFHQEQTAYLIYQAPKPNLNIADIKQKGLKV